jgi:hypothetical protein
MKNEWWQKAAEIVSDTTITNNDAADILLAQVDTLGWERQDDATLVADPNGKAHYMSCLDLIEQAYEIVMLDEDLKRLGML